MPARKASAPKGEASKEQQSAKGTKRDVSTALELAKKLQLTAAPDLANDAQQLVEILTEIDARTGRRDPSTRKKAVTTVTRGKTAKRSRGST